MADDPSHPSNGDKGGWREKVIAFFVDGPYGKVLMIGVVAIGGAIAFAVNGGSRGDRYGMTQVAPSAVVEADGETLRLRSAFERPLHVMVFGRDDDGQPVIATPDQTKRSSMAMPTGPATLVLAKTAPPWELIVCRQPFNARVVTRSAGEVTVPVGCAVTPIQRVGSASSGVDGSK